jgi:hypothetical protein
MATGPGAAVGTARHHSHRGHPTWTVRSRGAALASTVTLRGSSSRLCLPIFFAVGCAPAMRRPTANAMLDLIGIKRSHRVAYRFEAPPNKTVGELTV